MAITDYRIIKDWEDGIADAVKAAIADGWQPIETDVVAQLNALLAGLRAAGVLEESAP